MALKALELTENRTIRESNELVALCSLPLVAARTMNSCRTQIRSRDYKRKWSFFGQAVASWMIDSDLNFLRNLDADAVLQFPKMRSLVSF